MPSKLRKAIGAVKDQTSISLAKVSNNNSSNIDVAVLKATTHDQVPVEDRYVNEVLLLISSNKIYATACVQAITKRIGRTSNWIVALKSLMLVLRIFQEGDPQFPKEVLLAMKRGSKILNLSSFRDDSNSSPWDYTAFVRTFALYLDERLDCFLMGKLQRSAVCRERDPQRRRRRCSEPICNMKPTMLLDKIPYWQRLLDRALATRPTGSAKNSRLVQISLYSVVRESFDLYRNISDGLALLLDSFFHLQYQSCLNAFQMCIKASKQFNELCGFYTVCKSIGVGRTSEYPSIQKISDELIETLHEFLKDKASFPTGNGRPQAPILLLPAPPTAEDTPLSSNPTEISAQSETSKKSDRMSEGRESEMGSLENSVMDQGTSTSTSIDNEQYLVQSEKQFPLEDLISMNESGTSPWRVSGLVEGARYGWEHVLAETASNISSTQVSYKAPGGLDSYFLNSLCDQTLIHQQHSNYNNPFLHGANEIAATPLAISPVADAFSSFPKFQATPTFCAQKSDETMATILQIENDPFAPWTTPMMTGGQVSHGSMSRQHMVHEQQLWLQQQNKIIARHIT